MTCPGRKDRLGREGTSTGLQGKLDIRDDERGKPITETEEELRRDMEIGC